MASAAAIHNALLDTNPEWLEVLHGEFYCDRYGEIPEGKLPWYPVRVFNRIDGRLVCCGMDPDIRSAQRHDAVERLTSLQTAALDGFQKTARELAFSMYLKPGDMQFLNNHIVVHARDDFEDHTDPALRRYLMRLWLSSPKGRALPEFMKERWGEIGVGKIRGGIRIAGVTPTIDPAPRY